MATKRGVATLPEPPFGVSEFSQGRAETLWASVVGSLSELVRDDLIVSWLLGDATAADLSADVAVLVIPEEGGRNRILRHLLRRDGMPSSTILSPIEFGDLAGSAPTRAIPGEHDFLLGRTGGMEELNSQSQDNIERRTGSTRNYGGIYSVSYYSNIFSIDFSTPDSDGHISSSIKHSIQGFVETACKAMPEAALEVFYRNVVAAAQASGFNVDDGGRDLVGAATAKSEDSPLNPEPPASRPVFLGKRKSGDPVAFLEEHWGADIRAKNVTLAQLRDADDRLVQAIYAHCRDEKIDRDSLLPPSKFQHLEGLSAEERIGQLRAQDRARKARYRGRGRPTP